MDKKKEATKILLVDDEASIREELSGLLEDLGYEVDTAQNSQQAYELIQGTDYAIHLTDIKMPRENGITLLDRAKVIRPDAYFIMITGHGDEQTAVDCLNKGAFAYLRKPVEYQELWITLENCLAHQTLIDNTKQLEQVVYTARNTADTISNPLSIISSYAQMLLIQFQNGDLIAPDHKPDTIEKLETIIESADRVAEHIRELGRVISPAIIST